jgi:CDGSH-type Zn-finger protein/uncharacterized Fe-S cluster protein YjdI
MEEDVHTYRGTDVEVSYDANRCIHVRACVEGLPDVFDADRRPWVDADASAADDVARVIERCPTGALQYDRLDGGGSEAPPDRNTVTVAADGPLYLRGDVRLLTPDGETLVSDTRVALCRCGHSENKPLCDGSHDRVFEAAGVRPEDVLPTDAERGTEDQARSAGPLTVTPTKDGPFQVTGRVDLRSAEGETARERAALCRCGASDDRPFCDGTHAAADFSTAEDE